jgi:hypothetical protein
MAVLHPPHLRQPAKANLHLEMMGLSSSRWFLPEVSTIVTKTSYPAACACMRFAEAARRWRRGKKRIVAVICSADTGISKRYLIFEGRLDTYPATSSGQDRFG